MEIPALKEGFYKDIPALDPVTIRKVRETFGIQGVEDFSPEGEKNARGVQWKKISGSVLMRDGYSCRVCGRSSIETVDSGTPYDKVHFSLEVHHIIPRKDNGSDTFRNLITLCEECHRRTFSSGYAGIPENPSEMGLYRFDKEILLGVRPEIVDAWEKPLRGTLENYRRGSDIRGTPVPFEGPGIEIFCLKMDLDGYRNKVSEAMHYFDIYDFVTLKARTGNSKASIRVLTDEKGNLFI